MMALRCDFVSSPFAFPGYGFAVAAAALEAIAAGSSPGDGRTDGRTDTTFDDSLCFPHLHFWPKHSDITCDIQSNKFAFLKPFWVPMSSARPNQGWERRPSSCLPPSSKSSLSMVRLPSSSCATPVSSPTRSRTNMQDSASTCLMSRRLSSTVVLPSRRILRSFPARRRTLTSSSLPPVVSTPWSATRSSVSVTFSASFSMSATRCWIRLVIHRSPYSGVSS